MRSRESETPYEKVEPRRSIEYRDHDDFDRIAFAMRALRRLRTSGMTIAVYQAVSDLRVESGRDHGKGPGRRWAVVGIPPHASREHIAYALAELAGVQSMPFTIQTLLADDRQPSA